MTEQKKISMRHNSVLIGTLCVGMSVKFSIRLAWKFPQLNLCSNLYLPQSNERFSNEIWGKYFLILSRLGGRYSARLSRIIDLLFNQITLLPGLEKKNSSTLF